MTVWLEVTYTFNSKMFNRYQDYYYRFYSAKGFTFPHFLCLLIAYISISLPFYFCFAGTSTFLIIQISGRILARRL